MLARTLLFVLVSAAGCAEMVDWADKGKGDYMQVMIGCGILALELMAIIKWSAGAFRETMPQWLQVTWSILVLGTGAYLAKLFFHVTGTTKRKRV